MAKTDKAPALECKCIGEPNEKIKGTRPYVSKRCYHSGTMHTIAASAWQACVQNDLPGRPARTVLGGHRQEGSVDQSRQAQAPTERKRPNQEATTWPINDMCCSC